jgi:hypothetical protein
VRRGGESDTWVPVGPVPASDDVVAHGGLHQTSAGPYIKIFSSGHLNIFEVFSGMTKVVSVNNRSNQLKRGTDVRP